uniref:Glucosamine/galactosamine-6-phosphate isomerase domain-containing protein n=1 Tax=Arcella intermedia TaxID=1963864 RepID=A0A6B2KZ03_9EUKA
MLKSKEKVSTKVFHKSSLATKYISTCLAEVIQSTKNRPAVLALSSSSALKGVYSELVRLHKTGLSFANVVVFHIDEYFPIQKDRIQSFYRFMDDNLFSLVDIKRENVHFPDGGQPKEGVEGWCREYEEKLRTLGGADVMVLGVGRGGRLGFNEPGSAKTSRTRLVHLDRQTRKDVEGTFFGIDSVPKQAITMGVGTILDSKRIFLVAFGEDKAPIIHKTVEGPVIPDVVSSYLQLHHQTELVVDSAAARNLTRIKSPWVLIPNSSGHKLDWSDFKTVKRAVIYLSLTINKSILKLTDNDYIQNHLEQLLDAQGPAHNINLQVFQQLKETITGWPGGKPTADYLGLTPDARVSRLNLDKPHGTTTRNPTDYIVHNFQHISAEGNPHINSHIYPKKVLIFSPHPDDDVISMGGTLIRLVEQGHHVAVAYQTSGNYAVWDDDVKRFSNFATRFSQLFGMEAGVLSKIERDVGTFLDKKGSGMPDNAEIRKIKGLIRETEARAAARYCGVHDKDIHFLNLPFYETGTEKKNELSHLDVDIIVNLLQEFKPHQIYAAGDLSDPHGTHRVCLKAIFKALKAIKQAKTEWLNTCQVWLYRGAWQEWEPHEIDMVIPMSPNELLQKRYAIFKHQSQKDPPAFPGSDPREFWQRSEARNRETAKIYDNLGFIDYEGMEAFVLYDVQTGKI